MFKNFSWWKLYFWLAITAFTIGLPDIISNVRWNFSSWLLLITEVISLTGLYAYAFRREIFSARFWRAFFWSILLIWNLPVIYSFSPLKYQLPLPDFLGSYLILNTEILTTSIAVIFMMTLVLSIPTFYAVYKEGHKRKA